MSSTSTVQLNEEQEKFLSDLEEEFKHRYTEDDEEFKAVLNERCPPPPVVENWSNFRPRNERFSRHRHRDVLPYGRPSYRPYEHPYERRQDRYYGDEGDRYSYSSRQDHRWKM